MQPNDITFFQRFQDDILGGRKTITLRDAAESHFKTGDILRVGRYEDDGWQGGMAMKLNYRAVSPENKTMETHANPETLRRWSQSFIESRMPPPGEAEKNVQQGFIDNRLGKRIHLNAEPVVINGRIWVRTAMNERYGRYYSYRTVLRPDRWLLATFSLPQYDYNANPDPSTYPAALKRAFADMEAMLASLRVSTLNDDGAPDPFVVERVEPAPLPIREKRLDAQ